RMLLAINTRLDDLGHITIHGRPEVPESCYFLCNSSGSGMCPARPELMIGPIQVISGSSTAYTVLYSVLRHGMTFTRLQTFFKYRFIDSSLASYVPLTWLVTTSESMKTCKWWTYSLIDSSKPAINASYSDSLLEVGNSKRRAYLISFPSRLVKMRPAPVPSLLDAPSVYNVQTGVR
ncbi:hypothetical protein Tco_1542413, partial [Tanacetum coccineum]